MLPLLGVALHIFPRPNFKLITTSIGVFSIYFVVVAFINSWFYNYDKGVNYFFLNDDFLAKKFGILKTLRFNGIYDIPMGNLTFRVYPWYWLGIYIGFIFLTFATWFVYDALYKVSDHHYDWHVRKVRQKLIGAGAISLSIEEIYAMQEVNSSIKISHFSKIYGKNKTKAVDDFSLEVHQGEIFGFLGHNGAGKSTVIKSLVGIQSITEGTIEVCGFDIQKNPLQAKLMIGYVPDNHAVYERLTGREYVSYIADLFLVYTENRKNRHEKYDKMFGFEEALDKQIKTYSHGMKQKISVIASLIHNPKVWVLDEPLTGLDPTSAYQIKECMKEHAKAGNIVFFSSHVIEVVENICDRIAVIKKGHLVTIESIRDLKARGISLESIYLKYVGDINLLEGEPNVS
jgi:ABC-2 type transport system ATP-binding protein